MTITAAFTILVTLTCMRELTLVEGAKILVIPGAMVSHCLEGMAVGKELLNRGHNVTLFAHLFDPMPCISRFGLDLNTPRFKVVSPKIDAECARTHKSYFDRIETGLSFFQVMYTVANPMRTNMCHSAFSDKLVLKELEDDKYDIALADGVVMMNCLISLAVHLDVPYVSIGTYLDWYDSGLTLQTNTLPPTVGRLTNQMTFLQRVLNAVVHFIFPFIARFIFPSLDMSPYSDRLKGFDTTMIIKDSVLFLENSDYVIDYPKATFPNYLQVGALTATPARPLPSELQTYMDKSQHGVIIVAFGSVLKNMPLRVFDNILNAMQRFTENVLMKHNAATLQGNVKTIQWIPQNDVLGHPNARLFLSHCGKNSLWEGIYHGIPIICVPLATDGFANADKVRHYKVGSSLNIMEADADEIYETVKGVLQDATITKNMKKMSAILRDRPETSPQRAASAMEHVIKYGGSHLKPPTVNFTARIYADVWLTIVGVSTLVILFNIWFCKRFCCRRRNNGKQKCD